MKGDWEPFLQEWFSGVDLNHRPRLYKNRTLTPELPEIAQGYESDDTFRLKSTLSKGSLVSTYNIEQYEKKSSRKARKDEYKSKDKIIYGFK